jgi:hypothetical protein
MLFLTPLLRLYGCPKLVVITLNLHTFIEHLVLSGHSGRAEIYQNIESESCAIEGPEINRAGSIRGFTVHH